MIPACVDEAFEYESVALTRPDPAGVSTSSASESPSLTCFCSSAIGFALRLTVTPSVRSSTATICRDAAESARSITVIVPASIELPNSRPSSDSRMIGNTNDQKIATLRRNIIFSCAMVVAQMRPALIPGTPFRSASGRRPRGSARAR